MKTANLPKNWILVQLGDLGKWGSGGTPSKTNPNFYGGDIPWLKIGDLTDGLIWSSETKITQAGLEASSAKLIPGGALLVAMYGSIGKLGLTKISCSTNQAIAFCQPISDLIEADFLFFGLMRLKPNLIALGQGGTQQNISQTLLKNVLFPLPPLSEQRRIVEKIESLFAQLDHGEASLRDVQKLLVRYRQSVLKSAVTGQLTADWRAENADRFESGGDLLKRILQTRRENWQGRGKYKEPAVPDTRDLPRLPKGWVWASVEQLAEVIGGLTKNSKREGLPIQKPMLRVANVYQNRLDLEDMHETGVSEKELSRVALEDRDLLVVEGNGSKGQIGRMAVWRCEIPEAVHQNHLIKIRMIDKQLVELALWWFQSFYGRQNIEKVASSTSGLYTLSISKIESLVVPVPSLSEAFQITEAISEAFSKIEHLEDWCRTELARSVALRQSILKDAFAGKLVPQDPEDEPATELLARIHAERDAKPKQRGCKKANAS
ncbi:restriction endonuclease subunit S [Kushneria indalinina]|uniref:Type I restriction enzyme S subunit n=1 Tax=Kushneria indalinina DSM 14324 TaxID=1122140 RepID=A0A3D9DW59_9GAMM|nr:restriction endonuclease subunit S [Kushneria indalinina]REC94976.1 type I restriction enzyme S subunit [Kushneria indalinina DSM 14324]